MRDAFKYIINYDWRSNDVDMLSIGRTKRRNKYRKQQKRRARRVLKQRKLDY